MFDYSEAQIAHCQFVEGQDFNEKAKRHAIACANLLQGWCSPGKMSMLIDLVLKMKPKVIVEIGVWGGKSFVPMVSALKANKSGIAYGIDPWSNEASVEEMMNEANRAYWGVVDHQAIKRELMQKIWEFQLQEYAELIQSTSEEAPPIAEIELLHIDGNHSERTSYLDVTKWVPLMKKGGIVLFDDMTWYENGVYTTARAVEWLDKNCIKIAEFSDTSVWGIWVKP
jgi:predicted O-methyltransferase YrrM